MTNERIFALTEKYRQLTEDAFEYLLHHPELGYQEWESSKYLEEKYRELGYTPTMAGDIPGFYIDIDTHIPGPRIALFSELDALPCSEHPYANKETGAAHACGHNVQGAVLLAVGAILAEEGALDGLCGSIRLIIVPCEEQSDPAYAKKLKEKGIIKYSAGKQEFMRRGYLDGCDIAFMIHLGGGRNRFTMWRGCNGSIKKEVTFKGKASHAGGSPSRGINAMYAATLSLSAINSLRETFRDTDHIRVHPIIENAGHAVNVIPDTAIIRNAVRGATVDSIKAANKKVNRATAAAAAAMGAEVIIKDIPGSLPGRYDPTLTAYAIESMIEVVGDGPEHIRFLVDAWDSGCTDMGDVSCVMPALHAFGSGVKGTGHGKDYLVADFDSACLNSVKMQVIFLRNILSDNAKKAYDIIEKYTPTFASVKEYTDYLDSIDKTYNGVEYLDDGSAKLNY